MCPSNADKFLTGTDLFLDGLDVVGATGVRDAVVGPNLVNTDNTGTSNNFLTPHPGAVAGSFVLLAVGGVAGIAVQHVREQQKKEQESTEYLIQQLAYSYQYLLKQYPHLFSATPVKRDENNILVLADEYQTIADAAYYYDFEGKPKRWFGALRYQFSRGKTSADYAALKKHKSHRNSIFTAESAKKQQLLKKIQQKWQAIANRSEENAGLNLAAKKYEVILNQGELTLRSRVVDVKQESNDAPVFKKTKFEKVLLDQLPETRVGKASSFGWDFVTKYSMAYWAGWFVLWMATGAAAVTGAMAVGLTFGLPLIPLAIYGGWKLYEKYSAKPVTLAVQQQQQQQAEIARDRHLLMRNYYVQEVFENGYYKALAAQNTQINAQLQVDLTEEEREAINEEVRLVTAPASVAALTPAALTLQDQVNRKDKKRMATASGFMAGFLATFFACWPITAFLAGVGITAATGGTAVIAVAVVSLAVGIYMAVKKRTSAEVEIKDHLNLIEKKRVILEKTEKLEVENLLLEEQIKQNEKTLCDKIDDGKGHGLTKEMIKPILPAQSISENDRLHRRLSLEPAGWGTRIKRWADRAWIGSAAGGSGMLFVRGTIAAGAVFTVLFPPLAGAIAAGIMIGMGIFWAGYKIIERSISQDEKRDVKSIEEAESRHDSAQVQNGFLRNQLKQQKVHLKQLEKLEASPELEEEKSQTPAYEVQHQHEDEEPKVVVQPVKISRRNLLSELNKHAQKQGVAGNTEDNRPNPSHPYHRALRGFGNPAFGSSVTSDSSLSDASSVVHTELTSLLDCEQDGDFDEDYIDEVHQSLNTSTCQMG